MSEFLKIYEKARKELLSEQEQLQPEQTNNSIEKEGIQGLESEEQSISNNEPSEIKNIEEDSIKVDWIKKIIKLITLLNREDDNVEGIISKLSEGEVNADSLKQKESFIEELLRTIPSEKTS
jgi:hypothetical protein